MKKIFFILFLFILSCGYTPVNKLINKNYSIIELEISGNNQINKMIKKNFAKYDKDNLEKQFQLKLSSQLIKTTNSKNKSGTNANLSIKILINLEILEKNKILKNLSYEEIINYNSLDNKFELKQYEKLLVDNLTNKILDKIHFTLSTIE